jgi:hypothetical protein
MSHCYWRRGFPHGERIESIAPFTVQLARMKSIGLQYAAVVLS